MHPCEYKTTAENQFSEINIKNKQISVLTQKKLYYKSANIVYMGENEINVLQTELGK